MEGEGDIADEEDGEEENGQPRVFLPGRDKMEEGEALEMDEKAYKVRLASMRKVFKIIRCVKVFERKVKKNLGNFFQYIARIITDINCLKVCTVEF